MKTLSVRTETIVQEALIHLRETYKHYLETSEIEDVKTYWNNQAYEIQNALNEFNLAVLDF